MTHALLLNDTGISHKTTAQNENVHQRRARTICQKMSTTLLMRYLFQNYVCCCIFTLGANKRRSAPGWQLTDRNVGARGECLERRRKSLKENLSTSFSNRPTSAGTCGGYVRKVLFPRKADGLLKTTVERILVANIRTSSWVLCFVKFQTHACADTYMHII